MNECHECNTRKPSLQRSIRSTESENAGRVPPIVHEVLRSPGRPLDAQTRAFFEPRFDYDFSNVRVHTDLMADASARAISASAYTVGRDVIFRAGKYDPASSAGRALLAHELTHVWQQQPAGETPSSGLKLGSRHDPAEMEAERTAESLAADQPVNFPPVVTSGVIRRSYTDEPAAGCGICEAPQETGKEAHIIAQRAFSIYPSVTTEAEFYYPADEENGRLDLLRITKSSTPPYQLEIEIGEIKPNNFLGNKRGHKDLAFYMNEVKKAQIMTGVPLSEALVGFMELPAPTLPLAYVDVTSPCSGQALFIEGPFDGLYVYSCKPTRSSYPKDKCCQSVKVPVREPARQVEKEKKKKPSQVPTTSPAPVLEPSMNIEIMKFIRFVIETGADVEKAVDAFLKAHPEIAYFLYAAAAIIFIANIVEDIATLGAGLADEPAVLAICWALMDRADAMLEGS